jgi:multicomponent Na+:H+ antiporter subunit E
LPIDPQLVRVPYETESDLLTTIYANSITLTPGTVTVSVDHGEMEVHALTPHAAEGLKSGEMHRRVMRLDRRRSAPDASGASRSVPGGDGPAPSGGDAEDAGSGRGDSA